LRKFIFIIILEYLFKNRVHASLSQNGFHLAGNVVKAVVGGGGYVDGLLHDKQY
jgi:hypothetical protein